MAAQQHRVVVVFVAGEVDRERAPAVLALLAAAVPEKRSFTCRQPVLVRPLYSEAQLAELAQAYRAAHPTP